MSAFKDGWNKLTGRGSDQPSKTIPKLQEALNKFTGELYQENDAVTSEVKDALARVQGATVAIARAYDTADSEGKKAFEEKGLVSKNRSNGAMEVNAGILFDAKKSVSNFGISVEKINEWADKLEDVSKSVGVTDAQLEAGQKENLSRKGVNADKNATQTVPITPIYNALDPNLGAAGKAIAAVHTAIRGGYGDVLIERTTAGTPFNQRVFEDDPKDLKELVAASERLHNFINSKDGATAPTPQDMKRIDNGLIAAIKRVEDADNKLGSSADLSKIIEKMKAYQQQTLELCRKYDFGQEVDFDAIVTELPSVLIKSKEPEKSGDVTKTQKPAITKEELLDDSGPSWGERLATDLRERASKVKGALADRSEKIKKSEEEKTQQAQADKERADTRQEYLTAIGNGLTLEKIDDGALKKFKGNGGLDNLIAQTNIMSSEEGKTVFEAKDKSYQFELKSNGVTHLNTDSDVSFEEAKETAELLSLHKDAQEGAVEILGNDQQKSMYYAAFKALAPDIEIENEADLLKDIDQAILDTAAAKFASPTSSGNAPGGSPPPP